MALAMLMIMAIAGGFFIGTIGYSTYQLRRTDRALAFVPAVRTVRV